MKSIRHKALAMLLISNEEQCLYAVRAVQQLLPTSAAKVSDEACRYLYIGSRLH